MHLKKATWFDLYNEIKLKKKINKTLQNKTTKVEFDVFFYNTSKKSVKISEKILLKRILLYKRKEKIYSSEIFNNIFLVDWLFHQFSSKFLKKQIKKFNLPQKDHVFHIKIKIKSNQFDNFSNKIKRIYLSHFII